MDRQVSDLLGILREEITLYRDLVEHERLKTALLVRGSAEAILENNKTGEAFSSRLRSLAGERSRLCRDLCQALRIPREEFTLMKLAEKIEPSTALELRAQAHSFRSLVQELKHVSRRNGKLIEKSLRFSTMLLGIFCSSSGSYRQNGLFEQIPAIQPTFSQQA